MFILLQSKKQYYDGELERLEKQYQQQSGQMEAEHTSRLREDARRLKAQQEKELSRKSSALKADPKEVRTGAFTHTDTELGPNAWKQCISALGAAVPAEAAAGAEWCSAERRSGT